MKRQIEKLRNLRERRDNDLARRRLEDLRDAARGTDNIMYPIIDAVRACCTIGEIIGVLRDVFGEYRDPAYF